MNETMITLLNRRSIRKFKQDQITDEELNAVLEAGKYAPSGANQQSAIFVAVQNKEVIQKITKMNADIMGKDMDTYYGAPTIILVLADKSKVAPVEDGSIAIGNMHNAAYSLGLGACWVHRERQMFESEEGKSLLKEWGVEGDFIGVGSLILGYPDCEQPKASPRKENSVFIIK
ncbi:MAG: nitroreductase family protein [Sedimentibacter sp.]